MLKPLACLLLPLVAQLCLALPQDAQPDVLVPHPADTVNASRVALTGGSSATLILSGTCTATQAGAGYTFACNGTGSVGGFGTAVLSAAGLINNIISTQTSTPIEGTFSLIFQGGDILMGTFSIPAGILIPFIGGSTSAVGSAVITGGMGKFAGATGSFSSLIGTGTATGPLSSTWQVSSNGTISVPSTPGVLVYGGSFAHIASGGGWKTTMTFVNAGTVAAQLHLSFFDERGNALTLPLAFPQSAAGGAMQASTLDRTLSARATLIIESAGPDTQPVVVGSVQLLADGNIGGSAIFRSNATGQEAVVPLEMRNANAYVLPFDNTSGFVNGVAVANIAGRAASILVNTCDDTGASIGSTTIDLPAQGHISFLLADHFAASVGRRGTLELQTPANGQISALGIRATPTGAFTSMPLAAR